MDHVVYTDAQAKELENILNGEKTMILRGATGRKMPYGRVNKGDTLYFINNNAEGKVRGMAIVSEVLNSDVLTQEQSENLVEKNQAKLKLTAKQIKRWAGKRYLVLVEIAEPQPVAPFEIDKSAYGNMDDWLPVGDIQTVRR